MTSKAQDARDRTNALMAPVVTVQGASVRSHEHDAQASSLLWDRSLAHRACVGPGVTPGNTATEKLVSEWFREDNSARILNRTSSESDFRLHDSRTFVMSSSPLRLLVMARDDSARVQRGVNELTEFIAAQPDVALINSLTTSDEPLGEVDADLVLVLGGDGAILRTCHQLGRNQLPILGVNFGRLGFLADLSPDDFREIFPLLLQRQFEVVEHLMFECQLKRSDGSSITLLGLNESIVCSAGTLQMIEVQLAIDDRHVTTYSCDGLIVSTPVGSTAHSLSAGGPLLRQDMKAFAITPICPHSLSNRTLVDDADCVYSLSLAPTSRDALLVVDGQFRQPLQPGDVVQIQKAPVTFKLAKLPGRSYYTTLQRKLGWSGQPLYPTR